MALMKTISAIEGNNEELVPLIPKATADTSNMIASHVTSSTGGTSGCWKYCAFDDDPVTCWVCSNNSTNE